MDRRAFLVNSAQIACLLKLAPGLLAQEAAISPAIADMYHRTLVIDACAAIRADSLDLPIKPEITKQALEAGVSVINWTVSLPEFEDTVSYIAFVNGLVESDPAHWLVVRRHSDLDRAKGEKKSASCWDSRKLSAWVEFGSRQILTRTRPNNARRSRSTLPAGRSLASPLRKKTARRIRPIWIEPIAWKSSLQV